ncbi:calcium/sodium antiporter [Candidatus Uhrbacteria bacterium]|nr:calcium/sodium antiporter [Candidatus Uhrbacteria bacterium]
MPYFWPILLFLFGALFLYKGASLLMANATAFARNLGIPVIAIGFTIVAFGTSLPELIVGIFAGIAGKSDIVLGNILGSNMANIGIVLGLAALINPINLPSKNNKFELLSFILSGGILYLLARDGALARLDGIILTALGIAFTIIAIKFHGEGKKFQETMERAVTIRHRREMVLNILAILAGAALLFVGARMLVVNAVSLARMFRVSEILIGLTFVAIGTSLPEIVTAVIASANKSNDLAIGNVLGSNILNILMVLGLTLIISPVVVSPALWQYDLPILLFTTVIIAWLLRRGRRIGRINGILLLIGYFVYIAFSFFIRNNASL